MATPAEDIVTKLAAAGLGLTSGRNLFNGREDGPANDIPHPAVFCLDTALRQMNAYQDGGARTRVETRSVQVIVRDDTKTATLANSVYSALQLSPPSGYVELTATGPNFLGADLRDGLYRWSINADLKKEITTP